MVVNHAIGRCHRPGWLFDAADICHLLCLACEESNRCSSPDLDRIVDAGHLRVGSHRSICWQSGVLESVGNALDAGDGFTLQWRIRYPDLLSLAPQPVAAVVFILDFHLLTPMPISFPFEPG